MNVIALRKLYGADSEIGRLASVLAEQRLNLLEAEGDQRRNLLENIERTERDLALLLVGAK